MKRYIFIITFLTCAFTARSQENMLTFSGGYAFANLEDFVEQANGVRINVLYEFNPQEGNFVHGADAGYARIRTSENIAQQERILTLSSLPVYYAPKYLFGKGKVRAFIRGAVGFQFAWGRRDGILVFTDNDIGFYTGGGAGCKIDLGEKVFINAEYEIAYATNGYYDNGWLNSAMGGIGIKF